MSTSKNFGDSNYFLSNPSQAQYYVDETNRSEYVAPVAHRAYSHDKRESDYYPGQVVSPFVKKRLDGMVNSANQFRTKACGMMNQNDKSTHPRIKTKTKKVPGSSVT